MAQYAIRRLLQMIPVIFLVSVVAFGMVRLIPGDPAAVLIGPDAPPELIISMRTKMGFDKPLPVQYFIWVGHILRGDLGQSFINDFPVSRLIIRKAPATIELAIVAMIVATLISLPLGTISALHHGRWPDHLAVLYNSLILGIPTFWLGIILVLVFALRLGVLPPSGYVSMAENPVSAIKFIILPALTLGLNISAVLARFVRSSVLEVLSQDYVRTAYSKGLSTWAVVRHHVLKNALIPVVTVFGLTLGSLLGGAVITEAIFAWPGVGRLLVTSIAQRDYSVVQALILMFVTVYLLANLATDLLYSIIDPRIRRE